MSSYWLSPAVIWQSAAMLDRIAHAAVGFYAFDFFRTIPFDWSILLGRKPRTWTAGLYIFAKWSMLGSCIATLFFFDIQGSAPCNTIWTAAQFTQSLAVGAAFTILTTRTIAIWKQKRWMLIPLTIFAVAQWAILLNGAFSVWSADSAFNSDFSRDAVASASSCVILSTERHGRASFQLLSLYTTTFSLLLWIAATYGVVIKFGRTSVRKVWFKDGMMYFGITFLFNLLASIFVMLQFNPSMQLMLSLPAAVATVSAACRSYIHLFPSDDLDLPFGSSGAVWLRSEDQGEDQTAVGIQPFISGVASQSRTKQDNK